MKAPIAGLLLLLLLPLAALKAQAQLSYEPEPRSLEHLEHLIERSTPRPHGWNDSLLWFSAPGQRPLGIFSDGFESGDVSALDANGDGNRDLVFFRDDAQGTLQRMIVYDMVSLDTLFVMDLSGPEYEPITSEQVRFQGFYDFIGEGAKAVVFGGDGVVIIDPDEPDHPVFDMDPSYQYAGIGDLNDDGKRDLVVRNRQARRVEIHDFYEEN